MGTCAGIFSFNKTINQNQKVVITDMDSSNEIPSWKDQRIIKKKSKKSEEFKNQEGIEDDQSMNLNSKNVQFSESNLYKKNKCVAATIGVLERKKLPLIKIENNMEFLGEWKNGLRDGKGKQIWSDGSVFTGDWLEDKAHGYGILKSATGDYYEGEWKYDKTNGKGTFIQYNGSKYIG